MDAQQHCLTIILSWFDAQLVHQGQTFGVRSCFYKNVPCRGRFPRVFGDKFGEEFCDKFGDEFSESPNLVMN